MSIGGSQSVREQAEVPERPRLVVTLGALDFFHRCQKVVGAVQAAVTLHFVKAGVIAVQVVFKRTRAPTAEGAHWRLVIWIQGRECDDIRHSRTGQATVWAAPHAVTCVLLPCDVQRRS